MTSDDFIRAIIDSPEDDAPRLAYADWLEEQGKEKAAQFIRARIELAKIDTARQTERAEGWARERALLTRRIEEIATLSGLMS